MSVRKSFNIETRPFPKHLVSTLFPHLNIGQSKIVQDFGCNQYVQLFSWLLLSLSCQSSHTCASDVPVARQNLTFICDVLKSYSFKDSTMCSKHIKKIIPWKSHIISHLPCSRSVWHAWVAEGSVIAHQNNPPLRHIEIRWVRQAPPPLPHSNWQFLVKGSVHSFQTWWGQSTVLNGYPHAHAWMYW